MHEQHQDRREFRLVRYFYQWPQGNEQRVVADHLSLEEAQRLRQEKSVGLDSEDFVIEEMNAADPSQEF